MAGVDACEQVERDGLRELRSVSEAAVFRVEAAAELFVAGVEQGDAGHSFVVGGRRRRELSQPGQDLVGLLLDLGSVLPPRRSDLGQDRLQTGLAATVFGRKVGAAGEGLQFRGEKDRHGPTAAAGRRLDKGHVGGVHVGAFLPVHLDRHEAVVQQLGDGRVLEALALHDVAPVAGRVADREKDGLVFPACPGKGFFAPRVPIDGVVRVLEQIGRLLVEQPVSRLRGRAGGGLSLERRKRERGGSEESSPSTEAGRFGHRKKSKN